MTASGVLFYSETYFQAFKIDLYQKAQENMSFMEKSIFFVLEGAKQYVVLFISKINRLGIRRIFLTPL